MKISGGLVGLQSNL